MLGTRATAVASRALRCARTFAASAGSGGGPDSTRGAAQLGGRGAMIPGPLRPIWRARARPRRRLAYAHCHGAARQTGKPRPSRRDRHRAVRMRARLPCAVARGPRRWGAFTRRGGWRSPSWSTARSGAGGHRLLRRPPAVRRGQGGGVACGSPSAGVWRGRDRAPDHMRVPVGLRHAVRIGLRARGARGDWRSVGRRRGAALPAVGSGRPSRPSRRSGPDGHLHERRRGVCGWDHPRMRGGRASHPRRRDLSEWLPVACRHRRLGRRQRGPWGAEGPRWSRFDPVSTRSR